MCAASDRPGGPIDDRGTSLRHGTLGRRSRCAALNSVTDSKVLFRRTGLFFHRSDRHVGTIDLGDTVRQFEGLHLQESHLRDAEPFHVSAEIGFEWSPVTRLARILQKKTSSRNSLAGGNDLSGTRAQDRHTSALAKSDPLLLASNDPD